MHYLLFYEVGEDYVTKRAAFREAQLAKAWKASERHSCWVVRSRTRSMAPSCSSREIPPGGGEVCRGRSLCERAAWSSSGMSGNGRRSQEKTLMRPSGRRPRQRQAATVKQPVH